jgi:hypothetical protein
MRRARRSVWAITLVVAGWMFSAQARPLEPGGGDGEEPEPTQQVLRCLQGATASLSVTPAEVRQGGTAQLAWSMQLPAHCLSLGRELYLNEEGVLFDGSRSVQPPSTTNYSLKLAVAGVVRQVRATTLEVGLPPFVRIKGDSPEWRRLFVQAVGTPNTLVLLAHDLELDLTDHPGTFIAGGVTLTSEGPPPGHVPPNVAAPARPTAGGAGLDLARAGAGIPIPDFTVARNPRNPGPRVYTRNHSPTFLEIRCFVGGAVADHVRISGFRLHGPSFDQATTDEVGIRITRCVDIEISNMEIAGWGGQGIAVQDTKGLDQRLEDNGPGGRISNADQVKVFHNFIHHNQHPNKDDHSAGYGVLVGPGVWANIFENVFDLNRHAIAADGHSGGYIAERNLVLKAIPRHRYQHVHASV